MKRVVFIFILFAMCILPIACTNAKTQSETNSTDIEAVIEGDYVEIRIGDSQKRVAAPDGKISLLQTLSACGIDYSWTDDDHARFTWQEVEYTVSISDVSMIAEGSAENLIITPPGTYGAYIGTSDRDIYTDYVTMKGILFLLNVDAKLKLVQSPDAPLTDG